MGVYGYARNTTPSIDRLGASSSVFMNAHAHAPWTNPSLASMHTACTLSSIMVAKWSHRPGRQLHDPRGGPKIQRYHTEAYLGHVALWPSYGYGQGFDHTTTQSLTGKTRVKPHPQRS